jgi:nucleoid-associated protein YgaU
MAVYYKNIKGRNYDGKMIGKAESLVKSKGDGRISLKDAKVILDSVKDSDDYTEIEKKTIKYIRENFSFTPEADRWFRTEIRKWAAGKSKKAPRRKAAQKPARALKQSRPKKKKISTKTQAVEEYQREDTILLQRAGMDDALEETGDKKKLLKPFLVVIVILAAIIAALLLWPKSNEWMRGMVSGGPSKIKSEKTPAIKENIISMQEKQKPPAVEKQTVPDSREGDAGFYTVQVKDDLVTISEKILNDYTRWKEIYEANKDIIKNPYVIYPGQKLKIPGKSIK